MQKEIIEMDRIINIGPLPVYTNVKEQHRYKEYAFGNISPLISPAGVIPSFQFIYPKPLPTVNLLKALIYKLDDSGGSSVYRDIPPAYFMQYIVVEQDTTSHISVYSKPSIKDGSFGIDQGYYYLVLVFDYIAFTSEIWSYCDVTNCVKLSYTNNSDLSINNFPIRFGKGVYEPSIYLHTALGRPEYSYEEEVTERLGYKFIESQVSKKIYKFSFLATEFLLDALRIVRLCDTKICTYNGKEYDMITFDLNSSWEEQGDLASVDAEFETDNIITNLGGMAI